MRQRWSLSFSCSMWRRSDKHWICGVTHKKHLTITQGSSVHPFSHDLGKIAALAFEAVIMTFSPASGAFNMCLLALICFPLTFLNSFQIFKLRQTNLRNPRYRSCHLHAPVRFCRMPPHSWQSGYLFFTLAVSMWGIHGDSLWPLH